MISNIQFLSFWLLQLPYLFHALHLISAVFHQCTCFVQQFLHFCFKHWIWNYKAVAAAIVLWFCGFLPVVVVAAALYQAGCCTIPDWHAWFDLWFLHFSFDRLIWKPYGCCSCVFVHEAKWIQSSKLTFFGIHLVLMRCLSILFVFLIRTDVPGSL